MADSSEDLSASLQEFQNLQQQLQMVLMQKQQMAAAEAELGKAIDEVAKLADGAHAYRLVGSVFVPKDKAELHKQLEEEKESMQAQKMILEKQETRFAERLELLRKKFERAQKGEGASLSKSG
ncbi:MAG: prefoldin subunit beta [Candidatus Micrarchaeota archaeon]